MRFPIALQLYSVRDDMARDFEGTLKKVKALGYDGVEFAGLFDHSAAEVKALCRELGLVPVSAHVPFADMIADPSLLETYAEIGCRYVVIPYLTEEYRPGHERFSEVIEGAKVLGEKANALGMTLFYHNHDFEFVRLGEKRAIDVLYETVPASLLQAEFDTCWVSVGGEDPASYVTKYAGRVEILHLKDYFGEKTEHMYALIGIEEEAHEESAKFEFRPVGSGKLDFPGILAAAEKAGTRWVVVEQDEPSMGLSAVECAGKSISYLRSVMD